MTTVYLIFRHVNMYICEYHVSNNIWTRDIKKAIRYTMSFKEVRALPDSLKAEIYGIYE